MSNHPALSSLAARLTPSGIRKLEAVARTMPDLISFGPGQPDEAVFPAERIAALLQSALRGGEASGSALQYGPSQGHPELIEQLVHHMRATGVACGPANILVTSGAQQALDLFCQLTVNEGDTVLVQPRSYPGALQIFRARGARIVSLAAPREVLRNARAKFIYVMADFHNPLGDVLDVGERAALVQLSRELGVYLVEDSPYRDIRFSGAALPTLLETTCGTQPPDAGNTLYVGSFSKTVAPGLRVGWIVGPAALITSLTLLRQSNDLQSGTLSQALVSQLLASDFADHVETVQARYRSRRDALLDALATHLGGQATWRAPQGGFFVWLRLNAPIDTRELLAAAMTQGVAFVPGAEFCAAGQPCAELRLSFSHVPTGRMAEGVRRLASALAKATPAAAA